MKKLSTFLAVAALVIGCLTTTSAQLTFGVKAGLNIANINYDGELGDLDTKNIFSYHVGPIVEFGITENIGIGAGVLLSGKGFKIEETILEETFKSTSNPLYLQIPVTLNYSNSGFFAAVGPSISFGIAGKTKAEGGGVDDSEDISFGNTEDDDYNPLDIGVGLEAGYSFGAIRVSASYSLGVSNIIPKDIADASDEKATNNVIGVSVAYMIGK